MLRAHLVAGVFFSAGPHSTRCQPLSYPPDNHRGLRGQDPIPRTPPDYRTYQVWHRRAAHLFADPELAAGLVDVVEAGGGGGEDGGGGGGGDGEEGGGGAVGGGGDDVFPSAI